MRMQRISCTVLMGLLWASAPAGAAYGGMVRNAHVVGKILRCGGGAGPRRCFPADRALVSLFNSRHKLVERKRVTNSHFGFWLRPGRYTLRATDPGHATVGRPVTAKAHRTVHATLRFALH